VVAVVVHHLGFFYGYFGYDDIYYARLADRLLDGNVDYTDHYSYRWTVLLPTAFSYYLFGVSDFSTALPSLLVSVGVLGLLYRQFKASAWVLGITILLLFSVRWFVFYTDKLMPDVYVSFFLFWAWSVYDRARVETPRWMTSLGLTVLLLAAFLAKGTVILILPLLAYYFWRDWRLGALPTWRYIIPVGLCLLAAYFGLLYALTGSAGARFAAIDANSYFNECSYSEMPIAETWGRLTTGFASLVWQEGLLKFFMLAIGGMAYARWRRVDSTVYCEVKYYVTTIVVLFLSMNFMTISLSGYNPTCLDIRHFLFAVPIMAACVGRLVVILDLPATVRYLLIAFLVLSLLPTIKHMSYAKSLNYSTTKTDIVELTTQHEAATIVSNAVMINLIDFYSDFDRPGSQLLKVDDLTPGACDQGCYLVTDWYTNYHAGTDPVAMVSDLSEMGYQVIKADDLSSRFTGVEVYKVVRK
jgi:hypothetical protein